MWQHLVSACLLESDRAKSLFANMIASIQLKKKKAQKPKIKLERCDSTLNLSATIYIYM